MRILVAEDERITRRLLQRELERWGHEVVTAEDSAAAWAEFKQQRFDIVVSDWDMPRMDGHELIRRIRADDRSDYVYLIMLTGRSEKTDVVVGIEAGADDFLTKPFDRDELRVRLHAGERIIQLERRLAAKNKTLRAANERMQRDLKAAAKIQHELLPHSLPEIPGLQFAWHYQPCDELAGDLLNVIPLDDRHIALYVADVSGHGVASSLVSVSVHRTLSLRHDQSALILTNGGSPDTFVPTRPGEVARQLNSIYPIEDNGGHFLTLVYSVIDIRDLVLRSCCAGHFGPLLCRAGEDVRSFDSPNFPIGVVSEPDYEDSRIELRSGDRVFLYSDGLIEASNLAGELFGRKRLEAAVNASRELTLNDAIRAVVDAAAEWQESDRFKDDVSLLAMVIDPK